MAMIVNTRMIPWTSTMTHIYKIKKKKTTKTVKTNPRTSIKPT